MTVRASPPLRVVQTSERDEGQPRLPSVETAYREHSRYVASLALRVLGRDEEVDDVVHEVFVAATRGLSTVRDPGAVRAWLGTLALRIARRKLRARRVWMFLGMDAEHDYADQLPAPDADPADRVLIGTLYRVLDGLPAAQRIAWALRHLEGEPLADVARLCECSLATAKRRIAAAQERIEEALSHE